LLVGPSEPSDVVSAAFLKVTRTRPAEQLHNARADMFRAVTKRRARFPTQPSAATIERSPRRADADRRYPDSDLDVRRAVADLSLRQRAVVYFTYWGDLGEDRVADLLGISPGAGRRHLARARLRLRKVL